MAKLLSILRIRGVDHGDLDSEPVGSWSEVICGGNVVWNLDLKDAFTCDSIKYENLFWQMRLDSAAFSRACADSLASGINLRSGLLFARYLPELTNKASLTAGGSR